MNTYNGTLFDYTAGVNCGVLVKESTMKKLAKLQAEHVSRVKSLLSDEADNGNVFPSMWTLHRPEGIQTTVNYIDQSRDVKDSINSAVLSCQPRPIKLCFKASTMDEAKIMADEYFDETGIKGGR